MTKENKKGVKTLKQSSEIVIMATSLISTVVAVLGFVCSFHLAQAPKLTQVYVQGDENTVVLAQQCDEN